MSSFFPTPRHAAQSSSAAVKFCLLAVLCTVLAGVLAIFPALLIIDCNGNLESGASFLNAARAPLQCQNRPVSAGGMPRLGARAQTRVTAWPALAKNIDDRIVSVDSNSFRSRIVPSHEVSYPWKGRALIPVLWPAPCYQHFPASEPCPHPRIPVSS